MVETGFVIVEKSLEDHNTWDVSVTGNSLNKGWIVSRTRKYMEKGSGLVL